jgi:hypothetical protein
MNKKATIILNMLLGSAAAWSAACLTTPPSGPRKYTLFKDEHASHLKKYAKTSEQNSPKMPLSVKKVMNEGAKTSEQNLPRISLPVEKVINKNGSWHFAIRGWHAVTAAADKTSHAITVKYADKTSSKDS